MSVWWMESSDDQYKRSRVVESFLSICILALSEPFQQDILSITLNLTEIQSAETVKKTKITNKTKKHS